MPSQNCRSKVPLNLIRLVVAMALLAVPRLASADTIIDTSPSWDGIGAVQSPDTFGQTFTVGSDTLLKSFSFDLFNRGDHTGNSIGPIPYTARIYQWNSVAQTAIGPALYVSPTLMVPFIGGTDTSPIYQALTANPDVNLVSGLQYVALLTTSGLWQGGVNPDDALVAAIFNSTDTMMADVYPGGGFVDINSGNDPSLLTGSKWNQVSGDLWFQADLAPVPEPNTLSLLSTGLGGIWILSAFRKPRERTS
jgi:hypothetical protein